MHTFDFEGTFVAVTQDYEAAFTNTGGSAGVIDCTTPFTNMDGGILLTGTTAVSVSPIAGLQLTVTTPIEHLVGNVNGDAMGGTGSVNYCVQVTLCGRDGDPAMGTTDEDSCMGDPTVGRSVVEIVFNFNVDGNSVISGSTTAIDVEEKSTVFSEEFVRIPGSRRLLCHNKRFHVGCELRP